ncbi:hypothetical protein [Nostoc sp. 'Peltigera malacea cyanobiont' DB3992]|uniref:hypothetical protein n=1 Tax=Nostoc sp. 'Peltigera malacea cyanobiont' DB3992 TaxID=1206980 RepID=UPI000C051F6F|nr:hypothetical protein [Nostoc sp. 'Peltigera malacea cyanobiont' DB3992]PHM11081.1 hypothetical protein CK516_04730 [Nostoc sp. 'Peltigera malacea cyanobiont' DB3992]
MSNRQLEEMQEKLANQKLASELGISYDELLELEWDIDTNESDDGLIYEYIVTFSEESPKKILNKIEGIEDGYIVRLQPSSFEEPDDFE